MIDEIGDVAGLIWKYLEEVDKATAAKLVTETGLKMNEVQRAIGWLAREDKITLACEGRREYFSLKDS